VRDDRRQFNRVAFDTDAIFYADKLPVKCKVVDISLNGALLRLHNPQDVDVGSTYRLDIPLDAEDIISMELELTHQRGEELGLMCTNLDLDSATHLRRLVELNLGDPTLLERDFAALISDNESDE